MGSGQEREQTIAGALKSYPYGNPAPYRPQSWYQSQKRT